MEKTKPNQTKLFATLSELHSVLFTFKYPMEATDRRTELCLNGEYRSGKLSCSVMMGVGGSRLHCDVTQEAESLDFGPGYNPQSLPLVVCVSQLDRVSLPTAPSAGK